MEILTHNCSGICFYKVASSSACNFSRNELHHGHFPANFLKTKTTLFILFQNWPKLFFIYVWLLKEPFFVVSVCHSSSVNGNFKETFHLACFCFYLHFEHFHTATFFSSRKMATGIFSHLLWHYSPQTEQNTMKNPLSSFGSSSKNGTRHLQYNGEQYVTSFPRLTRFACCGNGVIVSFSNCANRCFLIILWL